jgi:hypothetical protein
LSHSADRSLSFCVIVASRSSRALSFESKSALEAPSLEELETDGLKLAAASVKYHDVWRSLFCYSRSVSSERQC